MLNICLVYISIHLDIGLLWCFLKPFLAFGTCVGPVSASFMFVITSACMSTCSYSCAVTHAFVCRLVGSEKFRQQLLKRRGKLVLLIPPKVGIGVKEVAEYLQPILTAAAGGSLDAYRRRQSHVVHQEALDTNQASSLCLAGQSFAQQLLLLIAFSCKH